jgi:DNA (cytosine-5)-methyltransferase 1
MRVLNLYAGLGGNRKLWTDCQVTAVEMDPKISAVYARLYPEDKLIIGDAHQYLLEHFSEFDLIWSSPPCQSHSRMIRSGRNRKPTYVDLRLYEEIMLLQNDYKRKWVVENVIPYYKPLITAQKFGRHLIWSNFQISPFDVPEFKGFIKRQNLEAKKELQDWLGIHYEENIYYGSNHCPTQILRNCVHPTLGLHIFNESKIEESLL